MRGAADAENGYYIVQGSGLPRIDVVGFARRVDWHTLLRQIRAVRDERGPTIQCAFSQVWQDVAIVLTGC